MPEAADTLSIANHRTLIRDAVLRESRAVQMPNFLRVGPADLRLLFRLYDAHFFGGELADLLARKASGPCGLAFDGRLRSSGGITRRRLDRRTGVATYEIVLSRSLLLDNFKDGQGCVLCGLHCADRLDGMMRVFEHELLHLLEFLRYGASRCAGRRFQSLSRVLFGHASHQHRMSTARQRTLAATTLRPGMRVRMTVEGKAVTGVINAIHKRATVLVESKQGQLYTNGKRCVKYYAPLGALERVDA
jgi:hypothetical protein